MPNTVLKVAGIANRVTRRLGASGGAGVAVELQSDDILVAIQEAIELYNRHRPVRRVTALTVTHMQKKYEVTHAGLQGVVDVQFVRESAGSSRVDPFDPYAVITPPVGFGAGETFGSLQQQLAYQESAREIVSAEPEWKGQWEGDGKYYLYIDVSEAIPYCCSYAYTIHATPDDNADTGMQHIPDGDVTWVMKYVTAVCKEILGRIRGKFHGTLGPDGNVVDNDYAELIEESKAEIEKLDEEIRLRQRPLAPLIG